MTRPDSNPRTRLCIGWGEKEGVCPNPAGSTYSPLWCQECDDERMAYLDGQFKKISERFA